MTKKNDKEKFKPGFHSARDPYHRGHIGYIFDKNKKIKKHYDLLSLTHDEKKRFDSNYLELEKNPNPKDNRSSFIRKTVEYTERPGKRKTGWEFSKKDSKKIQKIINKYYKNK